MVQTELSKKEKHSEFTPEPVSIVVVDHPNLIRKPIPGQQEPEIRHLDPKVLQKTMQEATFGTRPVWRAGYAIFPEGIRGDAKYKLAKRYWEPYGYKLRRNRKDIDPLLQADLLEHTASAIDVAEYAFAQKKALFKPKVMPKLPLRIVLVSGDTDHVPIIQVIEKLHGHEVAIELRVFAWKGSLAYELIELAGRENALFLDDIPGLVRPSSRRLVRPPVTA